MIKAILSVALVSSLIFCHKYPANIFFSRQELALTVLRPMTQAEIRFNQGEPFYYYIYSTKKFNTDQLVIRLTNLDNKGVFYAKTELSQTETLDVDPNATAARGKLTMVKDGQFVMHVYKADEPQNPIAQAEVWIE